MLAPDTVLQNRYRIVRQLGQGGMGTVYEALDERLGAAVALKETLFTDDALRKQFEREARLLARLHHPVLPKVSDHFIEGAGQFLVMQFVAGEDLEALRKRSGGWIRQDNVLEWADQILDALDYLHSQDPPVIHRDIKPQNLKLTARGQIILLDFGLAKGFTGLTTNVTLVKSFFGFTPMYAPLEQIRGVGTDPRSDLYSLAATLYHLLTGFAPADSLSRVSATTDGEDDPLRPALQLNGQVSSLVSAALSKAMALARTQRFASAMEMRKALTQAGVTPGGNLPASEVDAMPPTIVDLPPTLHEPPKTRGRWDEYSFFEAAGKYLSQDEVDSLRRLYEFSIGHARVTWGSGIRTGSFNAKFERINKKSIYTVTTDGTLCLNFAWLKDTQEGEDAAKKLGLRLRQLRGFNIPGNYPERNISVPAARWVNQVKEFIEVISTITQTVNANQTGRVNDEQTAIAHRDESDLSFVSDELATGRSDTPEALARIDEPVVAININQQYPMSKSAEDLYHATRGIWRLNRERAGKARYAFAVYQGVIKEVYEIERWIPGSEATRRYWREREGSQGNDLQETHDGRSEFIGKLAPDAIRKKYVGRRLPVRHSQNPIRYINC